MMIHEKMMSGQFLLDFKNDRTSMLHAHHQHQLHHQQPSPPPMTAAQLDIYSAYAYQQQQQQQQQLQHKLAGNHHHHHHQQQYQQPSTKYGNAATAEVLDLSRRCDSVETPRKTPSPYQTNSSYGSPAGSPTSSSQQQLTAKLLSANLLYSAQAQQSQTSLGLASLYPALYYPNVKQEAASPPPKTPPQPASAPANAAAVLKPTVAASSLLQSFASAAAACSPSVTAMQVDAPAPQSPNYNKKSPNNNTTPTSCSATMISPPSSSNTPPANDTKPTRPFKAFPRDPLVIAANFAATDVLLDNPRVERYTEYRKRVLEQIRNSNGGSRTVTNPKMRRTNSRNGNIHEGFSSNHNSESDERNAAEESSDCDSNAGNFDKHAGGAHSSLTDANGNSSNVSHLKDAAYYERRRKNNAAAKKSRDRRRIKEDEIAIRAAYLERQNIELLCQIDALKAQIASYAAKVNA